MTTITQSLASVVVLVIGSLSLFALINIRPNEHERHPASSTININIRHRQLAKIINPFTDPKSVTLRSDAPISNEEFLSSLKQTEEIWTRVPLEKHLPPEREALAKDVADAAATVQALELESIQNNDDLTICGRDYPQHSTAACPQFTQSKPILVLENVIARGRLGNNLAELLHAIQYAHDHDIQLGTMSVSWATTLITPMFMDNKYNDNDNDSDWAGGEWQDQVEKTLCAKIFNTEEELQGWDVIYMGTDNLFQYKSTAPMGEYMAYQLDFLRRFWTHYNTGDNAGIDRLGRQVKDMCSGINAIFGSVDQNRDVIYSAIHSRSMEGHPGIHHLRIMSVLSGCDRYAALDMHPEYVKAILGPLGMLQYPIVLITDGQNQNVVNGLLADPDIGPMLHVVPEEASWIGGDVTLAVNANVFIGNPVSSFGNFIAKSRLALGMGHNELFKARDENNGEWRTVCGDHCLFDLTP